MPDKVLYIKEEPWEETGESITKILAGKTLKSITAEDGYDTRMIFKFEDGLTLEFRFDWIDDLHITKET